MHRQLYFKKLVHSGEQLVWALLLYLRGKKGPAVARCRAHQPTERPLCLLIEQLPAYGGSL